MLIVRFLLRFVMIPLGLVAASLFMALLLLAVSGNKFATALAANSDAEDAIAMMLFGGFAMVVDVASASLAMMLPALLVVAIAEIAAIRSWLYYLAAGGLAAWIGWWTTAGVRKEYEIFSEPTLMAAAGIAGGLGYWLVAGWNAGFWKPVFASAPAAQPPAP